MFTRVLVINISSEHIKLCQIIDRKSVSQVESSGTYHKNMPVQIY